MMKDTVIFVPIKNKHQFLNLLLGAIGISGKAKRFNRGVSVNIGNYKK
jgi:hypothetical protein